MRNLEIIGEAAKQIPSEVREQYPTIPWRRISGFRDVAIHHYFGIDYDVVWDIVDSEVPVLLQLLREVKEIQDGGKKSN